jgi:hypothetical protein
MLMRVAGKVPDEMISQTREWLAQGKLGEVTKAVIYATSSQGIAMDQLDITLLADQLNVEGEDPNLVGEITVAQFDSAPPYTFSPNGPGLEDEEPLADGPQDDLDRDAIETVKSIEGAVGLWRTWRSPLAGSPWPPPRHIFLLETSAEAHFAEIAGRISRELTSAGESSPQVEVFPSGVELPVYQRMARAYSTLLWTVTPEPEIQIAKAFDEVDPEAGPRFRPDHPKMEGEEMARVLAYLDGGHVLMTTTAQMDDVVDTSRRSTVPMNFRTDGNWIWTDAMTYYLREHHLEPDTDLMTHIRQTEYNVPELDGVAVHRALRVLQAPAEEEPAWTYDPSA